MDYDDANRRNVESVLNEAHSVAELRKVSSPQKKTKKKNLLYEIPRPAWNI